MQSGRVSGLEVLRGYAALAVIVFHVEALCVPLPPGAFTSVVRAGSAGVLLFFSLSACSLLYGYSNRLFDERSLLRFFVRRFFRIAPLFYVMIVVYVARDYLLGSGIPRSDIVLNMLFVFPFLPGKHESLVWAGWSLGVEWMFYFVFPLFALIARNAIASLAAFVVFIFLAAAVATVSLQLAYPTGYVTNSTLRALIFFQSGVLAYALISKYEARGRVSRFSLRPALSASIMAVALGIFALVAHDWRTSVLGATCLALLFAVWVACAYAGLPRAIDHVVSRHAGRLSYSLYLLHPLVLVSLKQAGFYDSIGSVIDDRYAVFVVSCLASIGIVSVLAVLTYRLIESPGIALGERLLPKAAPAGPGVPTRAELW